MDPSVQHHDINASQLQNTGSSKKMDGIWNRYNLKSTRLKPSNKKL